jgi:hypothetical protein
LTGESSDIYNLSKVLFLKASDAERKGELMYTVDLILDLQAHRTATSGLFG